MTCKAIVAPMRRVEDTAGPQMLDARLLRVFIAVEALTSFVEAASILGTTPAAVTLQIQRLERALGVRLFDRRPNHRPALTPSGQILRPMALQMLSLNDEILDAMRSSLTTANDVLSVRCSTGR